MQLRSMSRWIGAAAAVLGLYLLAPIPPALAQTGTPPAPEAAAPKPVKEQAALDLLKQVSDKLAAARSFSVSVRDLREVATTPGQMMTLVTDARFLVQRPNRLRVEAVVGTADTLMIYDGTTFAVLDKTKNFYATAAAPATLDDMLETVGRKHGIHLAVSDFLVADPYALLSKGLVNAYVAGDALLDGVLTKQAVFSAPGIEFQIWIDPATSLPKLMTEAYLGGRRPVNFLIEFDSWNLDAKPGADAFAFSPPAGAKPIDFLFKR